MKWLLSVLACCAALGCSKPADSYSTLAREVFLRATRSAPVTDSLLVASFPRSVEQYRALREVMRQVPTVAGRDSLVAARIQAGNRDVLQAHLRYAAYVEGEEAMWYVEELDATLEGVPFATVCGEAAKAEREIGRARLHHLAGLLEHCDREGLLR